MSRTRRFDNGLNKGRDDKPMEGHRGPTSNHPKGYDTFDDDHGLYGPKGRKYHKKQAGACRRIWGKKILKEELKNDV